ncbi:hypothetical protein VCRA2126O85_50150 [Vibrio crassostreae]|nr:hypothetical protein VCRA2113O358_50096 [Vibrio crassostreae]CAK2154365.1 hypothetical protein VCRA2113O363_50172 [Vibrio crassostreae]CAK2361061.1 hypothetical protein VCRA2113O361_50096 [Vibrio crassostreae]CAK2434964.1 hypothetical protein VCRA2116O374_10113 [Vibrio crassostreae]CAK2543334.1 hypothetical protein VCRA2113O364_60095 [Vibrio crassostreae]
MAIKVSIRQVRNIEYSDQSKWDFNGLSVTGTAKSVRFQPGECGSYSKE